MPSTSTSKSPSRIRTRTAVAPAARIIGSYRKCGGLTMITSSPSSHTARRLVASPAMAEFVISMSSGRNREPSRSFSDAAAAACAPGSFIVYANHRGSSEYACRRMASAYPSMTGSWGFPATKSDASGPAASRWSAYSEKKRMNGSAVSAIRAVIRDTGLVGMFQGPRRWRPRHGIPDRPRHDTLGRLVADGERVHGRVNLRVVVLAGLPGVVAQGIGVHAVERPGRVGLEV